MEETTNNTPPKRMLYDYYIFICLDNKENIINHQIFKFYKDNLIRDSKVFNEPPCSREVIFWNYQNDVLSQVKTRILPVKLTFYEYDIPKDSSIDFEVSKDNFDYQILSDLKRIGISPSVIKSYSPVLINNQYEYPNCSNAAKLLTENSGQPLICEKILQNLISDPLRPIPNNEEILSVLEKTIYYQENKLNITDINQIKWFNSGHLYVANLEGDLEKCKIIKDLITFQINPTIDDRSRQIHIYRDFPEVTQKQIEICTRTPTISDSTELYSKFKDSIYYYEKIKNDIIPPSGPEFIHLIYAASQMSVADSWYNKDNLRYLSMKEDALKEKIYIQLGILEKYGFAPDDIYLKEKFERLKKDIGFGIRKKFTGLEEAKAKFDILEKQFHTNEQPEQKQLTELQSIKLDINNISLTDFKKDSKFPTYKIFPEEARKSSFIISDFNGEWIDAPDFSGKMRDWVEKHCPIPKPIFHTTLTFNYKPRHEKEFYKLFLEEFLARMGYINVPYIAYKDKTTIDVYTSNIVPIEGIFHPMCTVNHYRNALHILNELEIKYGFTKELELFKVAYGLKSYLDKEKPDDDNSKGQKPKLNK